MGFVAAVEAKDPFTERHSRRVAAHAVELARRLGSDANRIEAVETIETAALLHDIGKIGIPDHILVKPGKLTSDEFALVKMHPEMGYQILENISFLTESLPLILHHHERWDGGGYPAGRAEEAIPVGQWIQASVYLNRQFVKPFVVCGQVEICRESGGRQYVLLRFSGLSENVIDHIEKFIFIQHRRMIAQRPRGQG